MGNGVSSDQGNYTTNGSRDVEDSDEQKQQVEIELAQAPNVKKPKSLSTSDRNLHKRYIH